MRTKKRTWDECTLRTASVAVFALVLLAAACTSESATRSQSSPGAATPSVATASQAAATGLDLSFGSGGEVTTSFTDQDDEVHAVAIQPDGKIVAAGSAGPDAFALARYNADGTLDTQFGESGMVTTDFTDGQDVAFGVAIQADGKIVAAGAAGYASFALARYGTDGTLDPTFGDGGMVTTNFTNEGDFARDVAIQTDGKIVAAGPSSGGGAADFALARYDPDGTLDPTFGDGGMVTTNFGHRDDPWGITLQADGKIVAAGYGAGSFALARYDTDGTLDETFGTDGQVAGDIGGAAFGVATQGDGGIVAMGTSDSKFALARFDADGTLDPTFGKHGLLTSDLIPWEAGARIAIQQDGRILSVAAGPNFTVVRFNPDGTPDSTFGTDGTTTIDFGPSFDSAYSTAVALQDDGNILAAGSASVSKTDSDFALARYLAT